MRSGFSLITLVTISVLNNVFADDDSHHHHVIIHVPYKIHTIHHTILKHIHHQKNDKYEVLGYTIGKPIDLSHHLGDGAHHHHYEPPLPPPPPPPPRPLHHHEPSPPPVYHQHHPHSEESHHQEFIGGNELGYGHEWEASFGHEFHGGGYQPPSEPHYESHGDFGGGHQEFAGHHESFHHGGYE